MENISHKLLLLASCCDQIDTDEVWDFKVFSLSVFIKNKTSVNLYFWTAMHFSKIFTK